MLGLMLLAASVLQSLHDQVNHDALHSVVSCDYCLQSQSVDSAIVPETIHVASLLVGYIPQTARSSLTPPTRTFHKRSRAPPLSTLLTA